MRKIDGINVFGDPIDEAALEQIKRCFPEAHSAAMMADHHKGYAVPIGGVVAYENHISPSGVGYDIACGNKAVLTDADPSDVRQNINMIMKDISRSISFGVGRSNDESIKSEVMDDDEAWSHPLIRTFRADAAKQLSSVGGGNHYLNIFIDNNDRVWVGCHFGSRGLGHKIASKFIKIGGGKDGMDVKPVTFESNSDIGDSYIRAMNLAGRYAYEGRDLVCAKVASILGANIIDEVHNNHNFAWKEEHEGKSLWVIRKGATPAFPGQRSFIGGSMGDDSFIVEGLDSEESKETLRSTVHGAGRIMSRTEAKGKINRKDGRVISQGRISWKMMNEWMRAKGVFLIGGDVDESPHAYKRIEEVLSHHSGSIKIINTLHPIGVIMAGRGTIDPYKD